MKRRLLGSRGFTIIEVVLFLAISGLMMAGIIFAVSSGINSKRYTEAVDSFQDFLVSQYAHVDNVENSAVGMNSSVYVDGSERCGKMARGTSHCTIIGRYITKNSPSDPLLIHSRPIYATADINSLAEKDISSPQKLIEALKITVPANDDPRETVIEKYSMRWGTNINVLTNSDSGRNFGIVIIRLPKGKGILTHVSTQSAGPSQTIAAATGNNAPSEIKLCVEPNGLQMAAPVGIVVKNKGSGVSSLERRGDVCA